MAEKKKVEVIIFDTGPETRDRYTAVFVNDPDYLERSHWKWPALAMDDHPFSPRGFGQHVEVSRSWVAEQLKVGSRIRMEDLPVDTIACILQDMKEYQKLDYLD